MITDALVGWVFHEYQWRGSYDEIGSREPDIKALYSARSMDEIRTILTRYNIRYVYIGNLEYRTYEIETSVFDAAMNKVFEAGDVIIYESPVWNE